MKQLGKRLANLLTVKSIITLVATFVFASLALRDNYIPQDFLTIYSVIIAFYFGTQATKDAPQKPEENC